MGLDFCRHWRHNPPSQNPLSQPVAYRQFPFVVIRWLSDSPCQSRQSCLSVLTKCYNRLCYSSPATSPLQWMIGEILELDSHHVSGNEWVGLFSVILLRLYQHCGLYHQIFPRLGTSTSVILQVSSWAKYHIAAGAVQHRTVEHSL